MSELLVVQDEIILHEMMAHPAIFSHPNPRSVAVYGDTNQQILEEVLKHTELNQIWHNKTHADARVKTADALFDVIITTEEATAAQFEKHFHSLNTHGILIQQCNSPLEVTTLKLLQQQLKTLGFSDAHTLIFSQPHFATGWRCALMALKNGVFKRIREKDIYNRSFKTYFYNMDTHRAALALPEFLRKELMTEEVM